MDNTTYYLYCTVHCRTIGSPTSDYDRAVSIGEEHARECTGTVFVTTQIPEADWVHRRDPG